MAWLKALSVACPTCGAKKGRSCRGLLKQLRELGVANPHQSRIEAAQRAESNEAPSVGLRTLHF